MIDKETDEYISCRINCPVPVKNVFLGCSGRPMKYQKECPRLREFEKLKRRKENESTKGERKTDCIIRFE